MGIPHVRICGSRARNGPVYPTRGRSLTLCWRKRPSSWCLFSLLLSSLEAKQKSSWFGLLISSERGTLQQVVSTAIATRFEYSPTTVPNTCGLEAFICHDLKCLRKAFLK